MDPTPPSPPPATHSAAASGSSVGGQYHSSSRRGSMTMSSAALMGSSHYSHPSSWSSSQRRSSIYPPPSRLASCGSSSSSGSSSSRARASRSRGRRSKKEQLYDELCEIRSQSADYISRLDAIVADQRARDREQRLRGPTPTIDDQHHQSSSPSWQNQNQDQNQSSSVVTWSDLTTPPTGRNIISGYAPSLAHLPDLPAARSFSSSPGYYAYHHQQLQQAWPSSSSTSRHQAGSSWSSTLLSPMMHQDHAAGSSSTAMSGFAAFAHRRPSLTSASSRHHQQRQQLWNNRGENTTFLPAESSSSFWSSSSSSHVPSSSVDGLFRHRPSSSVSSPEQQQQHDALPPLPSTTKQTPPLLLPVKQEPVDFPSSRLEPELICIDNDDEEPVVADLDSLLASLESCPGLMASLLESSSPAPFPLLDSSSSSAGYMQQQMCGNNGNELMMTSWGATAGTISGQTWSPMPEQVVTSFGMMSIDGSSSSIVGGRGSMAWNNCQSSSMPIGQQQVPWQGGTRFSSSDDLSPHCWQSSPHGDTHTLQQFLQPMSAGFEMPHLPPSMNMDILPVANDSSTSSATDLLQYGNNTGSINWWNTRSSDAIISECNNSGISNMPYGHGHSSSTTSSISMPKLRLGGMESQRIVPPMSPSPVVTGTCSSMPHSGANDSSLFTDAEMERLKKDKRLSQLVNTNPKRVKRILGNRECSARMKARKENCIQVLERQFKALQVENLSLSSQVMSEQVKFVELKNENIGIGLRLQQLEVQAKMDEAESEALQAEIESLKLSELSGYSNDVPGPMSTHTGR